MTKAILVFIGIWIAAFTIMPSAHVVDNKSQAMVSVSSSERQLVVNKIYQNQSEFDQRISISAKKQKDQKQKLKFFKSRQEWVLLKKRQQK